MSTNAEPGRFERLTIAVPPGVIGALNRVASSRLQSRSEVARQAIIGELKREGVLEQQKGT
jgi:predicted transcriptional regulator